MTSVRRLPEPPTPQQCQELFNHGPYHTEHRSWRRERCERTGKDPDFCVNSARYEIDGVLLCRKHAGPRLLDKLTQP